MLVKEGKVSEIRNLKELIVVIKRVEEIGQPLLKKRNNLVKYKNHYN
jgi:hypothetical protein